MNVVPVDQGKTATPFPRVTRTITMDRATGTGGISMGVARVEPGATIKPQPHLVEEVMTLVDGEILILVGDETSELRGGIVSWVAPANTVHAVRNIGQRPATIVIAYPGVEVAAFPVDKEF